MYTTLDDTSEVWDVIPMMEFLIENTTDPNRISFLVTGVYKFRVGVRRSGSTDTITSADLSYRKDGVNVLGGTDAHQSGLAQAIRAPRSASGFGDHLISPAICPNHAPRPLSPIRAISPSLGPLSPTQPDHGHFGTDVGI